MPDALLTVVAGNSPPRSLRSFSNRHEATNRQLVGSVIACAILAAAAALCTAIHFLFAAAAPMPQPAGITTTGGQNPLDTSLRSLVPCPDDWEEPDYRLANGGSRRCTRPDNLEDAARALLHRNATRIQAVWRGSLARAHVRALRKLPLHVCRRGGPARPLLLGR